MTDLCDCDCDCDGDVQAFKIWSDKSVGTMSIVPFYTLFVNCVVWSIYGVLIDEAPVYA